MLIDNVLSDQLGRYLDLAVSQAKLTAENMANVDTPGYRAKGMDFEAEMRSAMSGVKQGSAAQPVHTRPEEGLIARPDGNNVSMDRESLNLAEAQLKFRTGVTLMRLQNQMVMDAIHADK
jgi:flagellar basal-body rod protein FlgB